MTLIGLDFDNTLVTYDNIFFDTALRKGLIHEKVQANKIITPAKAKLNSNEILISKILDKYPDFDPNWSPDVQKSWMEGMIKLYDGIN